MLIYSIGDLRRTESLHINGGTGGDDTLTGTEGDDTLSGLGGDDILHGLDGDDELDGGIGDDSLDGGSGNDRLTGGDGNDSLTDYAGNNVLLGGDGNDMLVAQAGANRLDGGAGNDILNNSFETAAGTLLGGDGDDTIYSSVGSTVDGGTGFDTLVVNASTYDMSAVTNIERIFYQPGDFALTLANQNVAPGATLTIAAYFNGQSTTTSIDASAVHDGSIIFLSTTDPQNGSVDHVIGSAGNDVIRTYGKDDFVQGGPGDDDIDTGSGFDTVAFSGNYADYTITADNVHGVLTVSGPDGTDTLRGVNQLQFADQTIDVTPPGVTLVGTDGDDTLTGDAGDDTLKGQSGNDVLDGSTGDDTLSGDDGNDTLAGGDGGDRVDAGDGNDLILGAETSGESGSRVAAGARALTPQISPNDAYEGGAGIDTISYAGTALGVVVNLAAGTASGREIGSDTVHGIENVIGGDGNDVLAGDAGANRLDGGKGVDTVDYRSAAAPISVALAGNRYANVSVGGAVQDQIRYIENLFGGNGADHLTGDPGGNLFRGGAGADILDGGAGSDTADYADKMKAVSATLAGASDAVVTVGGVAEDVIRNIENLIGGAGRDVLTGDGGANRLSGGAGGDHLDGGGGKDVLDGGLGDDRMLGGLGDDVYYVDSARDIVSEGADQGRDLVFSSISYRLPGNVEALTLNGVAAINATGNALANVIVGNDADNVLIGGAGADLLTGGAGADRFTFRDGDTGATKALADLITDFSQAQRDRIDLSSIDAIRGTPKTDHFRFIGTAAFSGTAGELRYAFSGNETLVMADTDGNKSADLLIRLGGHVALVGADFLLGGQPLSHVSDFFGELWTLPLHGQAFGEMALV